MQGHFNEDQSCHDCINIVNYKHIKSYHLTLEYFNGHPTIDGACIYRMDLNHQQSLH